MNLKTQLINDINNRARIKLAGFAEMKPYITNALLGGATLSAFTAIPALLHAYSYDTEDPLKTLAEVSKYSIPIGALLGAGATGASNIAGAINNSVGTIADSIRGAGGSIGNAITGLGGIVGDIGKEFAGGARELVSLPVDVARTIM